MEHINQKKKKHKCRTISALSLHIWPAQITQSYGGDWPANTVDSLALQILLTKSYNRRFLANTTKNMLASGAPRLRLEAPVACIFVTWICME